MGDQVVLFLPGHRMRFSFALAEDMHGGEVAFKEAIVKSAQPPIYTSWPCSIIDVRGGWHWSITPDGFLLIDPTGKIRQPDEQVDIKTVAKIRGSSLYTIIKNMHVWIPRFNPKKMNPRGKYFVFLAHAVLSRPRMSGVMTKFIRHCLDSGHGADTEFLPVSEIF
jgi:hypothetical protein